MNREPEFHTVQKDVAVTAPVRLLWPVVDLTIPREVGNPRTFVLFQSCLCQSGPVFHCPCFGIIPGMLVTAIKRIMRRSVGLISCSWGYQLGSFH